MIVANNAHRNRAFAGFLLIIKKFLMKILENVKAMNEKGTIHQDLRFIKDF